MEKLEHQEVPKLKGEMQKSILKESSQNFTNRQAQTKAVIWFLAIVIVLLSLGMIYLANMLNSLKEDSDTVVMDVVNDKADIVNESAESERIMDDITKD